MIVRVRTNVGLWRVDGLDEKSATVNDLMRRISDTRPHLVYEKSFSLDPSGQQPLNVHKTLASQGLGHGSMVYTRVDPTTAIDVVDINVNDTNGINHHTVGGEHSMAESSSSLSLAASTRNVPPAVGSHHIGMRRVVDKDGQIRLVPASDTGGNNSKDRGFRKGMMALRDMKMQWTLNDFIALDSQYEFKIKRQEQAICKRASLDVPSISDFQAYCQSFQFRRKRFGYCYGKYVKDKDSDAKISDNDDTKPNVVLVEAIYEPPQEVDPDSPEGFVVLDDPQEETVERIAGLLGLQKVGWIFCHEPRSNKQKTDKSNSSSNNNKNSFVMSSAEVIMAAELQLEAAQGVEETPFVTIKVTSGVDGLVSVEAFQVSQQCMAMVAEEALEVDESDPTVCRVSDTFSAIQEGKESKTVANDFFLTVVPIVQHTSEMFIADFPRANRDVDTRKQSHDEMKKTLQKSGHAGWTFEDRLADFNLLIYLSKFLDLDADYPKICASITNRDVPLDEGYKLIIKSMAGMEGSY